MLLSAGAPTPPEPLQRALPEPPSTPLATRIIPQHSDALLRPNFSADLLSGEYCATEIRRPRPTPGGSDPRISSAGLPGAVPIALGRFPETRAPSTSSLSNFPPPVAVVICSAELHHHRQAPGELRGDSLALPDLLPCPRMPSRAVPGDPPAISRREPCRRRHRVSVQQGPFDFDPTLPVEPRRFCLEITRF